jgi:hypothetical protein
MSSEPLNDSVRRIIAKTLHRLAHRLDRAGWWLTTGDLRREKREAANE